MRDAFFKTLEQVAADDPRVMFLTADLGYKLYDSFAEQFPGRFRNMGVSEANMISVAAGLALEGMRPFVYSIVPFATMRCIEQIRNDVCGMKLPVVVVGVGGGYAYGPNGPTHHGVDDLAAMRLLPEMTVLSPCDPRETADAVQALMNTETPAYLRLGRAGERTIAGTDNGFKLGVPALLREGDAATLLAIGGVTGEAVDAAELLAADGISVSVASVHTLKPIAGVLDLLKRLDTGLAFTIEEHGPCGGLFEAVCGACAEWPDAPRIGRISAPDRFVHECGSQATLRARAGLDAESIAARVRDQLGEQG